MTFLALLMRIPTKQAHARIMARRYHEQVPESVGYVRKTRRAATGSKSDLSAQIEHAIELRENGVRYNRAKEALIALYGVSERTAERRLRAAKQHLDPRIKRPELGGRETDAMPVGLLKINERGELYSVSIKRKNPISSFEKEIVQKLPSTRAAKGGSTKTPNLTVSRSREGLCKPAKPERLQLPGSSGRKPRGIRAGRGS